MNAKLHAIAFFAAVLLVSSLYAADECCPADAGKAATAAQITPAGNPTLPEGHPPVGGGGGGAALPEGHPPVGGGGGGMPEGHPPVGGASLQPAVGTLMVRVVQGTTDAPAVAAGAVTVELYNRGKMLEKLTGELDAKGGVTFEGVKIPGSAQPLVLFEHGGITFKAVGDPMTAAKPDQIVRLTVFEVTDQAPAWRIAMRHLMIHPKPEGLFVIEIVAVENPTDRAWKTASAEPAKEGEAHGGPTVVFNVPSNASEVQLGDGFDTCCTTIGEGKITHGMPLLPGTTRFRFGYLLKPVDGKITLETSESVPVGRLSVFIPDDGSVVEAVGLAAGEPMDAGAHGKLRVFAAQDLAADQKVSLSIAPPGADAEHLKNKGAAKTSTPVSAKAVAGMGMAALVAGAAVVFFRAKPRKP